MNTLGNSQEQPNRPHYSWFRAYRNPDALEIWRANPNAFWLVYVIAWRARYSNGFNAHGLAQGQCLLGDYKAIGLSKQSYRTAKEFLSKHHFATFKPTPKGTIATLISTGIFEVLPCEPNTQTNTQVTHCQHTANTQVTPNIEGYRRSIDVIEPPPQTPPTFQDVLAYGKELGAAEGALMEWFEEKQGDGWRLDGKPIRNWKRLLKAWADAQASRDSKRMPKQRIPEANQIEEKIHVRSL